jgi:hypothetical protein
MTLLEIAISLSLLVVVGVAVSLTLVSGMQHRRGSLQMFLAESAVRDLLAEIQDVANLPQNLPAQQGIGAVYARYNNQTFPMAALANGQINVTCFPGEATVPLALGGPQDLNFDGDAQDDLGSLGNGTDLKLVPLTLTATFTDGAVNQTITAQRLLTQSTD